jgi:hypothetical protein
MVMHYFKWSGVLAIRTIQCIPMLFLYYTLHLYYTGVGLLAWLLILLPYIERTPELLKILVFTLLCYHIPPRYPHYASAGARGYWI